MRRDALIVSVAVAVVVLVAIGAMIMLLTSSRAKQPPASAELPAAPPPSPSPEPVPMQFTAEGVTGQVAQAVERVVGEGRAEIALHVTEGGRWVCILVDGPQRYYELDQGLSPADFPFLGKDGFHPPPPPVGRTLSIYRSVAKTAMAYDQSRGDRIIVLTSPRDAWPKLSFQWPAPATAPK